MPLDVIWQETLVNQCDIYRPTVNPNSDGGGTPGNRRFTLVASAVRYLNYSTRNFADPSPIGRILEPSSISVQWGYAGPDCPWKDQDVLRDVTPGGLLFGVTFRVLGPVTAFDPMPAGILESSFSMVELRQLPKYPDGLPVGQLGGPPRLLAEAA